MRIDILNTVREEMRDQVTVIVSSLDNLMVVATLMLSIGFGFAVEGTFPPAERDYEYSEVQQFCLVLYAILAAMSLVFPLACMMLTIAARFEVELCQQDVMGDLQRHLLKALHKDQQDESDDQPLLQKLASVLSAKNVVGQPPAGSPRPNGQASASTGPPPPQGDAVEGSPDASDTSTRPLDGFKRVLSHQFGLLFSDDVGRVAEDEVRLIAEGLLQKVNHYHTLYPVAQLFLWLGMLSSVLVCSVLLGLYFAANFPETPWMWRSYSGILASCAILTVSFYIWMKYRMLREPLAPPLKGMSSRSLLRPPNSSRSRGPQHSPTESGAASEGNWRRGWELPSRCRNGTTRADFGAGQSDSEGCFQSAIEDGCECEEESDGELETERSMRTPLRSARGLYTTRSTNSRGNNSARGNNGYTMMTSPRQTRSAEGSAPPPKPPRSSPSASCLPRPRFWQPPKPNHGPRSGSSGSGSAPAPAVPAPSAATNEDGRASPGGI